MPSKRRPRTEYGGGGVMPNTVFPKGTDALTAGERLRLMSITGQTDDSRAPVDPGFWQGNDYFDPNERPYVDPARIAAEQQREGVERLRYRESRR